jgi:hypothetical protein
MAMKAVLTTLRTSSLVHLQDKALENREADQENSISVILRCAHQGQSVGINNCRDMSSWQRRDTLVDLAMAYQIEMATIYLTTE